MMDFNYRIPHAAGEIALSVTGAGPQAAVAAIQMGFEIVNMLGGQVAPDAAPVAIEPEAFNEAAQADPAVVAAAREEMPTSGYAEELKADSAGVPFDPELHTGTLKKDGTWRLKRGAASAASEEADEGNEPTAQEPLATQSDAQSALPEDQASPSPAEPTAAPEGESGADLPEISDAELQRYCGRLAAHFGGPEKVFALAQGFVPEGEMPRPSNIKDQASRHAFIAKAQEETGVMYHG